MIRKGETLLLGLFRQKYNLFNLKCAFQRTRCAFKIRQIHTSLSILDKARQLQRTIHSQNNSKQFTGNQRKYTEITKNCEGSTICQTLIITV